MWLWIVLAAIISVGFVAFTGAPYVPSKRADVRRAFTELYRLGAHDVLLDIGSGDGIVLREASRLGVRAVGYEIHPLLVMIAKALSLGDPNVTVRFANFWRLPFPDDTTVVYTFGESRDIERMYGRIQGEASRLGRDIAFVSYAFQLPQVPPTATVGAHHLYTIKPLHT